MRRCINTQSEFNTITARRYYRMRDRSLPFELPYSLKQFREWVTQLLGGQQGIVRCEYCNHVLNINTLQFDHRQSLARGGDSSFRNLAPCCELCNQQKGGMTYAGFLRLLTLVNNPAVFDPIDRVDLLGRLQSQYKLAQLERGRRRIASNTVRLNPIGRIREPKAAG